MSILDYCATNIKSNSNFWSVVSYQKTSVFKFPVVLSSTLFFSFFESSEPKNVFLTKKFVYFSYKDNLIAQAKISWSIIESFLEEEQDSCKYGFSIKNRRGQQDFYVQSESDIEKWLSLISSFCLMTGFDQDYYIVKSLDSGRTSQVSLCQDIITNQEFAVKEIRKNFLQDEFQIFQLKEEIRSLRKVTSPHCVKLFRVYEEKDSIYMIMEYFPHGSLLNRLQSLKKISEPEACILMRNIFEALFHFREIAIVHRDLKLDNIMMASASNSFEIKIIDFGLACRFKRISNEKCGSPGFMAPEVFEGERYDDKVDVFSAGVVGFAALTGKMPFCGRNVRNIIEKNERGEVVFEEKDWRGVSNVCVNFMRNVLVKDPNRRPSAIQALNHPWIYKMVVKNDVNFVSGVITYSDSNK